jgi:hypothetical protein
MRDADMDQDALYRALNAPLFAKQEEMKKSGRAFVHYTNAEAALSMLQAEEVWMRKSRLMNDFMEIDHGWDCLSTAYSSEIGRGFRDSLDSLFPNITSEIQNEFDLWLPDLRDNTYIMSISEHDETENSLGRLSMWRAYGPVSGVAIVFNPRALIEPSDALSAWTYPVMYDSPRSFADEFQRISSLAQTHASTIAQISRETVKQAITDYFRLVVLTRKHPGFAEEREWRIVHSPNYDPSDRLLREVKSIRGSPQLIYKIPLKDVPEEGLIGAALPTLVRRVISGPAYDAPAIREAFISLLRDKGVDDVATKVICSTIPLRRP